MAIRTVTRWIRRRVRAWLFLEGELAELRTRIQVLERRLPAPERRSKEHPVV